MNTENESGQVAAPKRRRGFALLTPENRRIVARMGGQTAHALGKAHRWTPEEARRHGRAGGRKIAENLVHMASIGRKGGFEASKNRERMARIGRLGGEAIARNRKHMAEIGARGGAATARRAETPASIPAMHDAVAVASQP